MMVYFSASLTAGEKIVSEGNSSLGSVRTEQIKRAAKELVRRFPDKFSNNFDANKKMVNILIQGTTAKVKNQIAGYIVRILAEQYTEVKSAENAEEGE